MQLTGRIRSVILFDICEAIRLDEAGRVLLLPQPSLPPAQRSGPDYVRFERPPLIQTIDTGLLKFYDYGVVSYETDYPYTGDWQYLVDETSRRVMDPSSEPAARRILEPFLTRIRGAMVKPYDNWQSEDYHIVTLTPEGMPAQELVERYGSQIAQIVRGEALPLSESERKEVLQSSLSYYPNDLLVAGWSAAFVYDTPAAAAPTLQLLEYVNTQLLEMRHYDALLNNVLAGVYVSLEKRGFLRRWRLAKDAARLNTIRLDVIELTERLDNAIQFVSDMFYARMHRLVSKRVGVPDYRRLVEDKLETAGALYEFMVDQFHEARAFFLEVVVVIILIIEIVFLFRGKG